MKKYYAVISCVLLILGIAFYSAAACRGYWLAYPSFHLHILLICAAAICITVLLVRRGRAEKPAEKVAAYMLLPLAILFSICHAFAADLATRLWQSYLAAIVVTVCAIVAVCFLLDSVVGKSTLFSLCSGVICFSAFLALLAGALSYNISEEKISPDGKYSAIIAYRGDSALVTVGRTDGIRLGFVRLLEERRTVYETGTYRRGAEYAGSVEWKNSSVLLIDGEEHTVWPSYGDLGVYVPERKPNICRDTHGGFHGDGTYAAIYELSANEEQTLSADFENNSAWVRYSEAADWMRYPLECEGLYSDTDIRAGFYAFFNKQTDTREVVGESYSYNYIYALYSESEHRLYVVEFDT